MKDRLESNKTIIQIKPCSLEEYVQLTGKNGRSILIHVQQIFGYQEYESGTQVTCQGYPLVKESGTEIRQKMEAAFLAVKFIRTTANPEYYPEYIPEIEPPITPQK